MATTSLSLGEHWEAFIKGEMASGRYGSAREVVRDALRHLEERRLVRRPIPGVAGSGATKKLAWHNGRSTCQIRFYRDATLFPRLLGFATETRGEKAFVGTGGTLAGVAGWAAVATCYIV
jgi:Arc/MetJ-type ribon-helix-helix transcriptional regulator